MSRALPCYVRCVPSVGLRVLEFLSDKLWVTGLALLHIALAARWTSIDLEAREWAGYLLLGTVFPALVIALTLLPHFAPRSRRAVRSAQAMLSAFFVVQASFFLARHGTPAVALIACGHAALLFVLVRWRSAGLVIRNLGAEEIASAVAGFFALILAWTISAKLVYWDAFWPTIGARSSSIAVLLLATVLITFVLLPSKRSSRPRRAGVREGVALLGAACVIAFFGFNEYPVLRTFDAFHHWTAITGPAQLVREGGWLLWDVQAPYGFLSALAIAFFPAATTWQALHLLSGALLAASALAIFVVFQLLGKGGAGFLAGLGVAVAAVFLLPGYTETLTGVQRYPSVGAYRFIWCYALLCLTLWAAISPPDGSRFAAVAWTGAVVWALAVLWSAESGAYASAAWLPAYAVFVGDHFATTARSQNASARARIAAGLRWVALPPLLLVAVVAAIALYYRIGLGHFPDFGGYFDAVRAVSAEAAGALPMDPGGGGWVLVLVLVAVSTAAAGRLTAGSRGRRGLVALSGCFGVVWSTSSYFVAQSHATQVPNLAPVYAAVGAVLLVVLTRFAGDRWQDGLIRVALMPVFAAMLAIAFGHADFSTFAQRSYNRSLRNQPPLPPEWNVSWRVPVEDAATHELLLRAGRSPQDRITSLRGKSFGALHHVDADGRVLLATEHPALLPIKPAWTSPYHPRERAQPQFERWIARFEPSGWLLVPKRDARQLWVVDLLNRSHEQTKRFENADWLLVWFEFRRAASP